MLLQLRKEYLIAVVLCFLAIYAFVPTESETSTFPMVVRTVAVTVLMVVSIVNIAELRFQFAIPLVLIVFYFSVLAVISFSFRYFVAVIVVSAAFCWAVAFYQSKIFRRATVFAINFLIYFSIGFLVLQFLEYYSTGRLFDYHNLIFPWSEARLPLWSSLARVGGAYLEPGTYANWIYVFLLFRLFLDRSAGFLLVPLVSFTMIFSMSAWGVLVGIFVISVYAFGKLDKTVLLYFLSALIGGYVVFSLLELGDVWALLENKIFYSGSRESRDGALQEFLGIYPDWLIFGLGFGKVFCVDCTSPQDAGLIISLVVVYGLPFAIFVLAVIYFFAFKQGGLQLLVLTLPLLTTKLFYWEHVLWFVFMLSLLGLLLRSVLDRWNPEGVDEVVFLRRV